MSRQRQQRLQALLIWAVSSILLLAVGLATLAIALVAWGAAHTGNLPGDLQRQAWLLLVRTLFAQALLPLWAATLPSWLAIVHFAPRLDRAWRTLAPGVAIVAALWFAPVGAFSFRVFYCAPYFLEGKTHLFLYYGMNTKSTYLRVDGHDTTAAPLVIRLDDIGAQPGRSLHIETVGTYSDETLLKDGNDRRMTAVFSATDVLAGPGERNRVTGAIDAGANVRTNAYLECFLIFCTTVASDIAQDFRVDPSVDVVVPAGAEYLFLSPTPTSQKWADNSGFGFGVNVEVN